MSTPVTRHPTAVPHASGAAALRLAGVVIGWTALYLANRPLWDTMIHDLAGLDPATRLGHAVHFFFYDSVKILLLIAGMMFAIGMLRASLGPERVRSLLQGKHAITGYLLAAGLGALTPFCSCSSIPVFIGLTAAGVPLGVTFTFLLTSPMINQIAVIMLFGWFGWRVPVLYVVLGMSIAVVAGLALSRLPLERWIEPFVFSTAVGNLHLDQGKPTLAQRMDAARQEVTDLLGKVWIYVLVGIALGALIHGWVPDGFLASWAGPDQPWALPVAAVAGLPLYANVASVVPLVHALSAKGVALGTLMAFMTSVVALSLPSLIMLRRLLKWPLLALFAGVVGGGAMVVGLLFNLIL
jgi:uncharacterized protein